MFKNFNNVLTMLLVILIVAILGVVGYFAYSMLAQQKVTTTAQTTIDEFEKATTAVKKKQKKAVENAVANEVVTEDGEGRDALAELNALMENKAAEEQLAEQTEDVEPEKVYMENYEVMGRIEIPKTKVDYPVLGELTKKSLEIAVAIAYGPGLNQVGNTVIYGHNYRNSMFFSNNKKLVAGDKIYITDQYGERVEYTIYRVYQTTADDATYMTRDTEGRREISLQTCTDDSSKRIIIWAAEGAQVLQTAE